MSRTYVIAEAGVNHGGNEELAARLVEEAHRAGADAVKFQTFKAKRLVSRTAAKADYQKRTTGGAESQYAMLERLELGPSTWAALVAHAAKLGIDFLSTPFDEESLASVLEMGVKSLKIGSGDLTNAPLLRAAARSGLPMILSTGMATLGDIEGALAVVAAGYLEGRERVSVSPHDALMTADAQRLLEANVTVLHCTTEYPAPLEEVNLRAMTMIRDAFGLRVGYSDHTEGIAVPIAAVALGATVIEKHFTVDRNLAGPDHQASLEPAQLLSLVSGIRDVETALGSTIKRPGKTERANMVVARRSIVAAVPIKKGEVLVREQLDMKRPGGGLSPMRIDEVVGRVASRDYDIDEPIEL